MSQIEYLNVLKHHFLACYWTPINIYCIKYTTMTRHNKLGTDIRLNTNVLPLSCAVTALEVHRRPYREILTLTLFNLLRCSLYGGGFFCRWADTPKGGGFQGYKYSSIGLSELAQKLIHTLWKLSGYHSKATSDFYIVIYLIFTVIWLMRSWMLHLGLHDYIEFVLFVSVRKHVRYIYSILPLLQQTC